MNTEELEAYMDNYYGTENYYTNPLVSFLYTDGVKAFISKANACWFLQEANGLVKRVFDEFIAIRLSVRKEKADIMYCGDNGKEVKYKHIAYTDCPDGDWCFYYNRADNIICWSGEY